MTYWRSIETAAHDEHTPILAWFDHDADDSFNSTTLSDYMIIADTDYLAGAGVAMVVWRNGYTADDGPDKSYWMPGGWFAWLNDDASDFVANALHWMPLPSKPIIANVAS